MCVGVIATARGRQGAQPARHTHAQVGYAVRFDDATTAATRVKYLTDGLLIREAILDPRLRKYDVIFVDEAHERTVNTDVLLGLLKRAQAARRGERGLRIVVMSATLEQADFVGFFPGAAPARVEGRQFGVEVFYTAQPQASYLQATLSAIVQVRAPLRAARARLPTPLPPSRQLASLRHHMFAWHGCRVRVERSNFTFAASCAAGRSATKQLECGVRARVSLQHRPPRRSTRVSPTAAFWHSWRARTTSRRRALRLPPRPPAARSSTPLATACTSSPSTARCRRTSRRACSRAHPWTRARWCSQQTSPRRP